MLFSAQFEMGFATKIRYVSSGRIFIWRLPNLDLHNFLVHLAERNCLLNLEVRKCEIGSAGLWWCRLGRISTLQCWHPGAGFFDLLEQREKEWGALEISGSDRGFVSCLESKGTLPV